MTDREKAKREYLSGKSLKTIAAEIGVSDGTVRSWKCRDGWPKVQRKRATKKKSVASQKSVETGSPEIIEALNEKQQLFAELYVKSFNATQAYMTAYGANYNTAMVNGCKLLSLPKIKAYVQSLKELKKEALMASVDDVVEKMIEVAFSDIGNYVTFGRRNVPVMGPNGPISTVNPATGERVYLSKNVNYVDIKESWTVDTSLIAEVSQGKDGTKIKLQDPQKAREWLGRYFMANPLDHHKIEYDQKKQELDRLEYERRKKKDESEDF